MLENILPFGAIRLTREFAFHSTIPPTTHKATTDHTVHFTHRRFFPFGRDLVEAEGVGRVNEDPDDVPKELELIEMIRKRRKNEVPLSGKDF